MKQLTFISVLRLLAIVTVVFFHTYQYMYANHFPATTEIYHRLYFVWNQCFIINIAMPLFTVIAGYLFNYLFLQGKYQNFWQMAKGKALRLLVPYFVFGFLFMAAPSAVAFEPWKLLTGGFMHLWYLTMLFWCFIIGGITARHITGGGILLYIVLSVMSCISLPIPRIMGLHNVIRYYPWFLLGQIFAVYQPAITAFISRYHLAIPLLIPFCLQTYFFPVEYDARTWYYILTITLFLFGLWHIAQKYDAWLKEHCRFGVWLSQFAFGIYIFHCWLGPYFISSTAQRILPLALWAQEHIVLFPFILSLMIFFISFVLTWVCHKTKIGKFLLS